MFSLHLQLWLYFYAQQYFHTMKLSSVICFLLSTTHRFVSSSLDVRILFGVCASTTNTFAAESFTLALCSDQPLNSAGTKIARCVIAGIPSIDAVSFRHMCPHTAATLLSQCFQLPTHKSWLLWTKLFPTCSGYILQ